MGRVFWSGVGLLLIACGSGGGGGIPDSGGGGTPDAGGGDAGSVDAGPGWWETTAQDYDQDGYSVAAGDCDDGDPTVSPGVTVDLCDRIDNDCDGEVDEDFDGDPYEPNDTTAVDLGDLTDVKQTLLFGHLFPSGDQDRFRFYVDDGVISFFDIEAWLYGVPEDADYRLEMFWEDSNGVDQGLVGVSDREGLGGYELINHGGTAFSDDTGWYEVVVSSVSGQGCASPYTLHLLIGGL